MLLPLIPSSFSSPFLFYFIFILFSPHSLLYFYFPIPKMLSFIILRAFRFPSIFKVIVYLIETDFQYVWTRARKTGSST